ncbi:hypothetical protein HDU78_007070 [Chytriomyces hyalinus]|nr:hypothetical protein HDU78_007070 [Chytriomyces hyalinus]KAJ3267254.1 hypothetical protein HDU77_003334 [Chytriomyces hyalinus]
MNALLIVFACLSLVAAQSTSTSPTVSSVSLPQPTEAGTCFDCATKGCFNYGTCGTSSVCNCPSGFGGRDCLHPLCGSALKDNSIRPILPSGQSTCSCDDGFTGPTCGVCQSDSVCPQATSSGISVSVNQVCNKSPVSWTKQDAYCSLNSPLLKAVYPKDSSILLTRNHTHIYGSLWYDNAQQFMCSLYDCSQSIVDGKYRHVCTAGSCECSSKSTFCGGPGVTIDLTGPLKTAAGGSAFSCTQNGTDCNMYFEFLKEIFPQGLDFASCDFGECAFASANPNLVGTASVSKLTPAGIAGVVIASVLAVLALIVFGWSIAYQIYARNQPTPPPRKGVSIDFSDISYSLPSGQVLLNGVSSSAAAGQLTAIMGPSGAGKSTLLDILAGKDKRGIVSGTLTFDGVKVNPLDASKLVAYVDQDDLLLPSLTVRETLYFSAKLRLPESMSVKEKMGRVDEVLETLGLSHVAHSRVGGFGQRGISGGERRRVSIGVELVTSPGILFLDEPTSGLDSFNAHAVIEALHTLAHVHSKTVVFTVHQPRSDMYTMFDQVIVLAGGAALYAGRGVDAAQTMKQNGTPCPEGYNMADHLLDLAIQATRGSDGDHARDRSNAQSFMIDIGGGKLRKRKTNSANDHHGSNLMARSAATAAPLLTDNVLREEPGVRVGFLTQLSELVGRSLKHLIRTPSLFLAHISLAVILGIFVGGVYFKSNDTISGVQNRLGSLFFILSLIGFSSLSAIGSFAQERNLFIRERSNGVYGSMPYYLSKIFCDIIPLRILPALLTGTIAFFMVGYDNSGDHFAKFVVLLLLFAAIMGFTCLALAIAISDVGTATLVGAIVILFKMLFAGLIISQDSIPPALRWIQYISFFRYPYEGMAVNDMGLLQIKDTFDGAEVNVPAALILLKFGFNIDNYGQDLLITILLLVGLITLTGLLMHFRLKERR